MEQEMSENLCVHFNNLYIRTELLRTTLVYRFDKIRKVSPAECEEEQTAEADRQHPHNNNKKQATDKQPTNDTTPVAIPLVAS